MATTRFFFNFFLKDLTVCMFYASLVPTSTLPNCKLVVTHHRPNTLKVGKKTLEQRAEMKTELHQEFYATNMRCKFGDIWSRVEGACKLLQYRLQYHSIINMLHIDFKRC